MKAELAIVWLKLLHGGVMWGIKHPAQEIWGLLPFDSTEQIPCLSFPFSHRRMQCWGGLFPSWQFKEKRSHSMNYLWISCRGLVSFTHLRGPSSSTEVSPVWILQGLIRVVFTTAAFVGRDGFLSSTICLFLWGVKYSELCMPCLLFPGSWDSFVICIVFIICTPLLSCFQAKVTTIRLQRSLLELCFIAGTWQQMFYTFECGMRIYWWVWSLQAAAYPLSLFPVPLSFYSICRARRAATGMLLAVCQFDVKEQKTI